MKTVLLAAILSLPLFASAEVKPQGTVLETYCGHINRSVYYCIAPSPSNGALGYVVRQVNSSPKTYTPAVRSFRGTLDQTLETYSWSGVVADERGYPIETFYTLTVTYPTTFETKPVARLVAQGGDTMNVEFELDAVRHTK